MRWIEIHQIGIHVSQYKWNIEKQIEERDAQQWYPHEEQQYSKQNWNNENQ